MPQSLAHIALVVRDYDEAIAWFTGKLGFTLVADEYQPEQDKRWVLVAPPGAPSGTSLLLARAATPEQAAFIGNQAGGRVFLFLATDDFERDHAAMRAKGVALRPRAQGRRLRHGRGVRGSLRQSLGSGAVRRISGRASHRPICYDEWSGRGPLMAKTIDYYDLPDRIATAEKKLKIPKWFDDFTVTEDWELKKESVSLDLSLSTTIIEKSYVRRGDRCFRIEDYCIYGWNVTTVTGTRVFIFRVNLTAVLAAINQAGMVAVLAARRRLVEYIESQDDFDVAKAVEIITRLFPAIPFGEVFRELAGFADLPSLLGDLDAIADRAMKVQAELRRLLALEGTVFARFGHVRMVTSLVRVQVFSHKDLIEVECADFILELPEGEALRVPEQDDFPHPAPEDRSAQAPAPRKEARDARRFSRSGRPARAAAQNAQGDPRRPPTAWAPAGAALRAGRNCPPRRRRRDPAKEQGDPGQDRPRPGRKAARLAPS